MKIKNNRLLFLAAIIVSVTSMLAFRSPQTGMAEVKILTYNVRNCLGTDGVTDYKRIADIITRINPDVVALQELDSVTTRSKGIYVPGQIAGHAGMRLTYGPSISYQGGKYGIGILSKEIPVGIQIIKLPGREESRSLLVTEFRNYFFCCTHFSLNEEDRMASVEIINRLFYGKSKPVFLAGDLNALPGSEVIDTLRKEWISLSDPLRPTFPATEPQRCIDYIFARKSDRYQFNILSTVVEKEPLASDHLPLWSAVIIKSSRAGR